MNKRGLNNIHMLLFILCPLVLAGLTFTGSAHSGRDTESISEMGKGGFIRADSVVPNIW